MKHCKRCQVTKSIQFGWYSKEDKYCARCSRELSNTTRECRVCKKRKTLTQGFSGSDKTCKRCTSKFINKGKAHVRNVVNKAAPTSEKFIGCTKNTLLRQFPGLNDKFKIGFIKDPRRFDLSKTVELKKCFKYKNLILTNE